MVTITLENDEKIGKIKFPNKEKLYSYLGDIILKEQIKESEGSGYDGPFSEEEALQYLDKLISGNK